MASLSDSSDPILVDIHKTSLSCKDLLMEICQWTKEANREKNVTDALNKLINELEELEKYDEVKEEDTLAAISVNLQNLLPILLSNNISMEQLERRIKEANTLGIELITTLNKIKDKWLKNKGKISFINTSIQDISDEQGSSQNLNRKNSKRRSTFGFTRSFHNSISHLSHSSHISQPPPEEMEITGPIQSPLYMQEKPPAINTMSLGSPCLPLPDQDMFETILRTLPPKPTSSPFEVNAVPPLEIGKSYINNSSSLGTTSTINENIQLPTINSGNEESLEQNLLNVFDFIYGNNETDKNTTERKSSTNLSNKKESVDNYEYKNKSNYEYITQEIPETPLSETVFNQLSDNNKNSSKSHEFKTFSTIQEENNERDINNINGNIKSSKEIYKDHYNNMGNDNKNGYNIFLQYKGETKRIFITFEDIAYDLLKDLFIKQFDCQNDFKDKEFPKIYINNQTTIDLFYELGSSYKSKDELLSEIKELKSIINNKSTMSLNVDNNKDESKSDDQEETKEDEENPDSPKEKIENKSIKINTKLNDNEENSTMYKELYDIRASILDIVNNFVNTPIDRKNQVSEINTTDTTTHSEILDLKETINDWINYQKHISNINTLQTPVTMEPNNNTSLFNEPYKDFENILNNRITSIQDYMNSELQELNTNVNNKLDNIVTTIIEKSPTSSTFKTPDSEDFISTFNSDLKNNMNDSINELKDYIKDLIEKRINEKLDSTSYNNTTSSINDNLINEMMIRINNENCNRIREMEERFNKKLEALTNSKNRSSNEEQTTQTRSMLEEMGRSIKELKASMNSKNSEIERLAEMTQQINKNSSNDNKSKVDDNLKYMEFTKTLEEDLKQYLRKFKSDICNNIKNGTSLPSENTSNDNEPSENNTNTKDDQDTIEYVKQIRDNVDKQLNEFRKSLNELSENVQSNQISSSKGFNPEMIEAVRSFRSEMQNQYQEFTELMKDVLLKQQEENARNNKNLPTSVNKIIKDDTKETYNLINDEFFKLRQFMVEVIKISQTRKTTAKSGEIGQLPVDVEEQLNRKTGISPLNYNKLVTDRNELNVIKKNIKNIKQQFESFRFDTLKNMNNLKNLVSLLNRSSAGNPSEQRQRLLNEKNAIAKQSEMIKNKLQELRLLLESIGVDVSRKCNPKIAVMNYVKNEIKMINLETQRFTETIKAVNVNWKATWEKELQEIVTEQKTLKTNIESSTEYEDDCKTLSDGFSVILKVLSMQKDRKECRMNHVLDPEELKEAGVHSGLMNEIIAVTDEDSSNKRLEAIEKSLKIQEIVRENSNKNEFEIELNTFIENNKLKINKNVMEFENQQKAKKDELLKQLWRNEHNKKTESEGTVPAM
ncbi:hypothetical protein BCR36DRAFT_365542 [Piromyces finnis]|uniref:Actin interacting protein 3 C-terminal domain-containing protein n=1 Tax=Piromyces finnis TaxID=1754191 RepID=A0A1Y1VP77_9FUNG|nr:hypothetical protein BCR36DRAFT_365542 [Piromyces finnis]|eukprot:ORX60953.1 hypothetical protein BCR36DRAFT_365542 [Piromyces finnis]